MIIYVIIGILLIAVFIRVYNKFKFPKLSNCILVNGAIKSGKSTYSVAMTNTLYKRQLRKTKVRNFLAKVFLKKPSELPLIYSNVPLAVPYVEITKDILERKKRVRFGSVVYIQEATLLADNSIYKEMELSERIMLFNKLFGHESHGGYLIYDTQATLDLPAVTRRCLAQRFYVHSMVKWLPFILLVKVKEERYSEETNTVTQEQGDVEDKENGFKWQIIPKRTWKLFDCYCFSSFTDDLPIEEKVIKTKYLKAKDIVSFKDYETIKRREDK